MPNPRNTHEACHHWAHQVSSEGRAGNVSYNGPVLYSYSTAIAELFTNKRGETVAVIGDATHSSTTSKHVSEARHASRHLKQFRAAGTHRGNHDVTGFGSRIADTKKRATALFNYSIEQAAKALAKAEKARKYKDLHDSEAAHWLIQAQEVNAFFGLRRKVDAKAIERLKEAEKREASRRAQQEKIRLERRRAEERERLEKWLAGKNVHAYFTTSAVHLRVAPNDPQTVQTSLGAEVPRADVERAYRFITSKRGQQWRANGETCPVGHYQINAINERGLVAGCHTITWQEVERFARVLGIAAADAATAATPEATP